MMSTKYRTQTDRFALSCVRKPCHTCESLSYLRKPCHTCESRYPVVWRLHFLPGPRRGGRCPIGEYAGLYRPPALADRIQAAVIAWAVMVTIHFRAMLCHIPPQRVRGSKATWKLRNELPHTYALFIPLFYRFSRLTANIFPRFSLTCRHLKA
jgi:hypothetical protein